MSNTIKLERVFNKVYSVELGMDYVIKRDVISLNKGDRIDIKFINTDSEHLQGIRIATISDDSFLRFKRVSKKEYWFWENEIGHKTISLYIDSDGEIMIYNACYIKKEKDKPGVVRTNTDYAGMIVEKIDDSTSVYHCNDFAKSTEFKSLVFKMKIKRVK